MIRTMLLAIFLFTIATPSFSQSVDQRRTVSVEGEAEAFIAPDRASVNIGVETEGMDVKKIKAENDKRVRSLFTALKTLGIEAKDVQTSNLQIEPVYNYRNDGKRELVKYVMRNTVHVIVRDLAKVEGVIDAGVDGGVNILNNVEFETSNAKAVRDSLRIAAAKDAQRKASDLAAAVGAKVGKPLNISESGGYTPQPVYRAKAMMMAADAEMGTPVAAGQMVVRVTVSAVFELE